MQLGRHGVVSCCRYHLTGILSSNFFKDHISILCGPLDCCDLTARTLYSRTYGRGYELLLEPRTVGDIFWRELRARQMNKIQDLDWLLFGCNSACMRLTTNLLTSLDTFVLLR
jgi:hypothetical protein